MKTRSLTTHTCRSISNDTIEIDSLTVNPNGKSRTGIHTTTMFRSDFMLCYPKLKQTNVVVTLDGVRINK